MRKRSGGLHSDSQQEFLILAELSHEKTGYFYDEKHHSERIRQVKLLDQVTKKIPNKPAYTGFQYSVQDYYRQEQKKQLQIKTQAVLVNTVIICDNQADIKLILLELWPRKEDEEVESPERRHLDLFMTKIKDIHGQPRCFKFWIIEAHRSSHPIYHSYLKRASKILNFSQDSSIGETHDLAKAELVLSQLVIALQ